MICKICKCDKSEKSFTICGKINGKIYRKKTCHKCHKRKYRKGINFIDGNIFFWKNKLRNHKINTSLANNEKFLELYKHFFNLKLAIKKYENI